MNWSPEQRLVSLKMARGARLLKFGLSVGVTIWNGIFGGATWDGDHFSYVVVWCLGIFVASWSWEGAWRAHDFLVWARQKL